MNWDGQDDGWLCNYCNLKNRKHAIYCATCGGHWEEVAASATTPRGGRNAAPANRRPSPRHRGAPPQSSGGADDYGNSHQGQHQGGRGKGRRRSRRKKAAVEETKSPFQSYSTPANWTSSSTPFPAATAQTSTAAQSSPINEEILLRLQEAYVDKEMPQEVKATVEKAQATQRKSVIKGLHSATKELDRASQRLSDAINEKKKHRNQWMQHLEESVQLWQTQLESYKKRQAELRDEARQAQKDVLAARQSINEQNAKSKPASLPATATNEVLDLTGEADAEEEDLQKKLQSILEQCAGTVGAEGGSGFAPSSKEADMQDISSDDAKLISKPKRARSAEPLS